MKIYVLFTVAYGPEVPVTSIAQAHEMRDRLYELTPYRKESIYIAELELYVGTDYGGPPQLVASTPTSVS